jgi:porin
MINYTQFLSAKMGVTLGKMVTFDSSNEFGGGAGKTQFFNMNLIAPVTPALIVPYSVLGSAVFVMPTPDLTITGIVGTSQDTSNHSGFDYLDEGKFAIVKVSYQYEIGELPGGFTNQYGYGFDNDFILLNSRLDFGSGSLTASTQDDTWFNAFDLWQYLWVEDGQEQRVNINNGAQDLQGVGIFLCYQFANEDTNPIEYAIGGGISGKGLIPNRDNDTMGIGYNYTKLQDLRLGNFLGIADSASVWEFFYRVELTPAIHLTLDAQINDGALPNTDKAVILGSRLEMRF